ncbi:MAG: 2'-5' RNA ligase family protein [Proteobacteria bacterium]|nr:2'-5' RNA ligase family protein [Pseudomonadota bacterium]
MNTDTRPLILTLVLDDPSQAFFDRGRSRWFPPHLNVIPAHVTLFHALPGERAALIRRQLETACARQARAEVQVSGLRSLGRGVAYTLGAPEMAALRSRLAALWHDDLTAQDRQGWRPHVTVQNKVAPEEAKALLAELSREFVPFSALAVGLALWRYDGGPWEKDTELRFAAG